MKRMIGLGFLGFMVTIGYVVGSRMSPGALAAVVGVVIGVLAGIPMAVLLLIVVRRSEVTRRGSSAPNPYQAGQYPPVIVVTTNGQQGVAPASMPMFPPAQADPDPWQDEVGNPHFVVLGDE